MQKQIEKLEQQVEKLQPLTDDQIDECLAKGDDAQKIVEQEQSKQVQLKVAQVQLNRLRTEYREQRQTNARREVAELRDKRDKVKASASASLKAMVQAVDNLEAALSAFDEQSQQAATLGADMNRTAKIAGLPDPLRDTELTSLTFSQLHDRCDQLLKKRRNTQFREAIFPQE